MVSFKASLVRTIGIAAVASGLLLSSVFSAFADTRTSSYTTLAYSPPPPSLDLKSPTMVRENDVIIGDITPERRLTTASGDLKAGTTTARSGCDHASSNCLGLAWVRSGSLPPTITAAIRRERGLMTTW